MIMKCDNCGITFDSAYGHYNCVPSVAAGSQRVPLAILSNQAPAPAARAVLPVDVIEAWDLTYNLGVAVDNIGRFSLDKDLQYLEEAIQALQREMNRVTGGHR